MSNILTILMPSSEPEDDPETEDDFCSGCRKVGDHLREQLVIREKQNKKWSYQSLLHLHSPQVNVPLPEQCGLDSSYKKYHYML